MKTSDPLLLADVALPCGMYPAGKVILRISSQVKPCSELPLGFQIRVG
jgi:hypothetical protein